MAKLGFHSHPTLFLLHTQIQNPICHFHCRSISIPNHCRRHHHHHHHHLSLWPNHICRSRKWDPNAENFNSEQTQDLDYSVDQWFDVLEDYVDSLWIFKVFGSFGWSLPFILSSLLLSTGPKAFLMALALPLGQSTLTFAFQRLLNKGKAKPRLKHKPKKGKSRAYYGSRKGTLEGIAEWIGGEKRARKKRKRYQKTPTFNGDVSVSSGNGRRSDFGGWDELDEEIESSLGSTTSYGDPERRVK